MRADRGVAVTLAVAAGDTTAVVGRNGAGKSTLVQAIAGLLRPDDGTVAIGGRTVFGDGVWVPPHRRRVALLGQRTRLFPHLSVRANVEFAPRSAGRSRAKARAAAEHWLDAVDGASLGHRRPHELSGGQAQRIAIARALAAEPDVLLLDEPMAALDVAAAADARSVLRHVLAERTTVLVTHDATDVLALADTVAVLHEGALVDHRPAREALLTPATRFVAQLTGLNYLPTDAGAIVFPPDALDLDAPGTGGTPARITDVTLLAGRCRATVETTEGPPSSLTADLPLERYAELAAGQAVSALPDPARVRDAARR
ncbi:ABC transporter ATP-binding protein [Tsukamurella sp. 8F]|uniref:sulfate/molybdate ABC transporter ATP-binding protein n=1 Tax=unclassified Tsukamurella TaxID=2633480 RepID=UPI0023B99108|nr:MULTISPECIES: ABC transporter ATP-binding protein [unclassified Tsukamurella]MDF0532293.1 ABC transporter ATP-binding protein [Tsukamurella sp. 8J]MDF0589004.1 ABC transporter ATP-binding protein [Tsukamurella sp. 8F]